MLTLYIDTCSNMHTVVSHMTGPLYVHIVSLYRGLSSKTNRVQVVSKQEAFFLYR